MNSTARTVTAAAGIMMAAIFLSRILGMVRDMVIANQFGAGGGVDAYRMAFMLPDTLYFVLSSGALSSAFIPVFVQYWKEGKEDEAWKIFSVIGTFIFLVLGSAILLCEIFAPQLVRLVAYGFAAERPELLGLTTTMTRIVLPSQLFFFMGGLLMATLYARQHFLAPATGPIIYNVGIILGGLLLASTVGVKGLTWGALTGAFLGNFLLQLIVVRRLGLKFKPSLNLRHPGVVKVGKLALPVILGLSLPYVASMVNFWFGAFLQEGTVAALGYANRLYQVPLGVFGQGAAIALFPTLAALAAGKQMSELRSSVNLGLRGIFLLTIPSSVLMAVLAMPIVVMIFRHGEFAHSDAVYTASALLFYSIGVAGWAGQAILARGFYSLQDTIVPVVTGTICTLLFVPMNYVLVQPLGHNGLALATSIAGILNMLALLMLLRRRLGGINGGLILQSLGKVITASAVTGVVAWTALHITQGFVDTTQPAGALIAVVSSSVPAVLAYAGLIALLRVDEAAEVWKVIAVRLKRRRPETEAEA